MPTKYYKNHFSITNTCPVDFHTACFNKNFLHIYDEAEFKIKTLYLDNHIPNWHKELEILYCIDGYGTISCGGKDFKIAKNDIFVINSERTHMVSTDTTIKYHCIVFDQDFFLSQFLDITKIEFCALINNPEVSFLYQQIVDDIKGKSNNDMFEFEIRVKTMDLMLHLYKNYVYSYNKQELDNIKSIHCRNAISYIFENYKRDVSIDEIAEHCIINKAHLSRIFKKETNHTIINFINIIRCNNARQMIAQGMSVRESAIENGFNNLSYFSRTYKKHIGCLPSDGNSNTKI